MGRYAKVVKIQTNIIIKINDFTFLSEPLFIFDLGASVGDVKWAPYSSTVLAALTTDGKVFVFDINVNKYKPICVQQVVPRKSVRLTRIAFNKKIPFIIVGDDKWVEIYSNGNSAIISLKIAHF